MKTSGVNRTGMVVRLLALRRCVARLKRAAAELRKKEERYRSLIEASNSMIFFWKPDGTITYMNQAALDTFGYRWEEVVGKSVMLFVSRGSEAGETLENIAADIVAHPERYVNREDENRRKNGETVWSAWTNKALVDPVTGETEIISIGNNITRLKQAERELRRRENEFRSLTENSPDIVARLDRHYRYLYINPAGERIFGIPKETIIGKTNAELGIPPEQVRSLDSLYRRTFERGEEQTMEFPLVRPAVAICLQVRIVPERSPAGIIESVMTISRDVTALKRAQEIAEERARQAEEGENILNAVLEHIPEAITIVDAKDHRIRRVSRYWEKLGNLPVQKIEGMSLEERGRVLAFLHSDGKTPARIEELPMIRSLARGETVNNEEWALRRSDGRNFSVAASAGPIRDADGHITGAVASWRDVTEQKKTEERIRYVSFHDRVTGLYNRTYFEEELRRLDTKRELPLSVIMGDVNNLKMTNDAFGHREGDALLQRIARILAVSCRNEDIIARWGGDEFVILLPKTDAATADEVAKRIQRECRAAKGEVIRPSIALGGASKTLQDRDIDDILREAEDRMYRHKLLHAKAVQSATIASLLKTVRDRGYEDRYHLRRVRNLSMALGRALSLTAEMLQEVSLLSVLHDIGKAAVPPEVVLKRGGLSRHERELALQDVVSGYRITKTFNAYACVADDILALHERWDGTGSPQGLHGEDIPLPARIVVIADAYDAMTHRRPYRSALSDVQAANELQREAGNCFDPHLTDLFIRQVLRCSLV